MGVTNSVTATLIIRNGIASNWTARNPVLQQGEIGLESNTFLFKIGDGIHDWEHLPYINKLNSTYFKRTDDGSLTFSDSFAQTINNIIANAGGSANLVITNDPTEPTDPVNLRYLQWAIAHAGHLKRSVVNVLPSAIEADENTLYMVPAISGDHYEEYMVINGVWDMVGTTGDGGSGSGTAQYQLPIAAADRLGGVRASSDPNKINVTQDGFMTLNEVSTSLLYVPAGDTLILYGGTA